MRFPLTEMMAAAPSLGASVELLNQMVRAQRGASMLVDASRAVATILGGSFGSDELVRAAAASAEALESMLDEQGGMSR